MKLRTNFITEFINLVRDEIKNSSSSNKFLLYGIIANLPTPLVFVPYLTQAITIVLVSIFLKNYPKLDVPIDNTSSMEKRLIIGIPAPIFICAIITILIQFAWIPFITQLLSLTLLALIFIYSRKIMEIK